MLLFYRLLYSLNQCFQI